VYIARVLNEDLARRHRPDEFPAPPRRSLPLGSGFVILEGSMAVVCFGILLIGAVAGEVFSTVDGPSRVLIVVVFAGSVVLNAGFVWVNVLARFRPDSALIAHFWPLFWPKGIPARATWASVNRS
jgi:hypothetical protein